MNRLIDHADFSRKTMNKLPFSFEKTKLMAGVIAPAVQHINALLIDRDFSSLKIRYGNFNEVPALWIDRNRFQQVVFNLLSNAIKYAYNDPNAFAVDINAQQARGYYLIYFRDWGTGIDEGFEELIFDEGYRLNNSQSVNVTGEGLGLWIVRQIIEGHGGKVKLTNNRFPTEFTLFLPMALSSLRPYK